MEQEKEGSDQLINLQISLNEAKVIFKALGKMPFADVYELIGKLNEQTNKQLHNNSNHQ